MLEVRPELPSNPSSPEAGQRDRCVQQKQQQVKEADVSVFTAKQKTSSLFHFHGQDSHEEGEQ